MKKLFSIVLCISTFVVSSAQNFSELDLIGKWNGISGEIMAFEVNNKSKVNWNFDAKGSNFGQLKYSNNLESIIYLTSLLHQGMSYIFTSVKILPIILQDCDL